MGSFKKAVKGVRIDKFDVFRTFLVMVFVPVKNRAFYKISEEFLLSRF